MVRQAERSAATIGAILEAARTQFAARGFDAVSIDDIGRAAGVAKGAVYHHFDSKRAIFEAVLEGVQSTLASELAARGRGADRTSPAEAMAAAVHDYLQRASSAEFRRILLIDGPVVLGWQRWRAIDDRYFAAGVRKGVAAMMAPDSAPGEIDALYRLVSGAVMEAALACGESTSPAAAARHFAQGLRQLLSALPRSDSPR